MERKNHYETVSEALNELRKQGFTTDFNLEENCLVCNGEKFDINDFEIVDVYRYEGNSDPGDEAAVYALQSSAGIKGVLVTGYGNSTDPRSVEILAKLDSHNKT
ncbi:MAG TPA: phosphoribosylpyrophosphate synthetase [Sphingobacteriaceae bacterium]